MSRGPLRLARQIGLPDRLRWHAGWSVAKIRSGYTRDAVTQGIGSVERGRHAAGHADTFRVFGRGTILHTGLAH
eukprot:5750721-Prymnesium_polylepis.1